MASSGIGSSIWNMIVQTSALEWFAVITSILYVLLASKQKRSCWSFALISSLLYIYIGIKAHLYVDSILNAFYALMAIIGWFAWQKTNDSFSETATTENSVHTLSVRYHLLMSAFSILIGSGLGYLLSHYSNQAYPYIDSIAFCFSLFATWMISKKIVENWLYFIVIDATMIFIYYGRMYYLTSLLFVLYTALAIYGYFQWKSALKQPVN